MASKVYAPPLPRMAGSPLAFATTCAEPQNAHILGAAGLALEPG